MITMPRTRVLRLPGIRLDDYVGPEALLEQRLLEAVLTAPEPPAPVSAPAPARAGLPLFFRDLDHWPVTSPLLCWGCDRPCTGGPPRFIPGYLTRTADDGYEFGVRGVACRFVCAARWIADRVFPLTERQRVQGMLVEECHSFSGRRPIAIPAGPPREALVGYGGDLERDEFDALADALEASLGVPSVDEILARQRDAVERDDTCGPDRALSDYKERVSAMGLLK